jgi:hypothetical protein
MRRAVTAWSLASLSYLRRKWPKERRADHARCQWPVPDANFEYSGDSRAVDAADRPYGKTHAQADERTALQVHEHSCDTTQPLEPKDHQYWRTQSS